MSFFCCLTTKLWKIFYLSNLEAISNLSEIPKMCKELEKPALTCFPKPETPAEAAKPKRFRSYTEKDLQEFQY